MEVSAESSPVYYDDGSEQAVESKLLASVDGCTKALMHNIVVSAVCEKLPLSRSVQLCGGKGATFGAAKRDAAERNARVSEGFGGELA